MKQRIGNGISMKLFLRLESIIEYQARSSSSFNVGSLMGGLRVSLIFRFSLRWEEWFSMKFSSICIRQLGLLYYGHASFLINQIHLFTMCRYRLNDFSTDYFLYWMWYPISLSVNGSTIFQRIHTKMQHLKNERQWRSVAVILVDVGEVAWDPMTSCLSTEKQAMNGMLPHQSRKGKCHIVFIQETSRSMPDACIGAALVLWSECAPPSRHALAAVEI